METARNDPFEIRKMGHPGQAIIKSLYPWRHVIACAAALSFVLLFGIATGLIILGVIYVHEMGHVRAMRRLGLSDARFFFIPFAGGFAISSQQVRSDWQWAYVALAGAMHSMYILGVLMMVHAVIPSSLMRTIILAMVGVNLLNLLPIMPLDGGQVMTVIARTIHPWATCIFLALSSWALCTLGFIWGAPVPIILGLLMLFAIVGALDEIVFLRPLKDFISTEMGMSEGSQDELANVWQAWARDATELERADLLHRAHHHFKGTVAAHKLRIRTDAELNESCRCCESKFMHLFGWSTHCFEMTDRTPLTGRQAVKTAGTYLLLVATYVFAGIITAL